MNAGQYEGIILLLAEIRDRMPDAPAPVAKPLIVHHLDGTSTTGPAPVRTGWPYERYGPAPVPTGAPTRGVTRNQVEEGAHLALVAMSRMLDSWIADARGNHKALEHRNENTGEECWRTFAPGDIRSMVNDVARELGLAGFPEPTTPEEDKPL